MMSYDRIYEQLNIASEMVSGQQVKLNIFKALDEIWSLKKGGLGNVYVKYLEPLNLYDYLKVRNAEKLEPSMVDSVGLELTEELLQR